MVLKNHSTRLRSALVPPLRTWWWRDLPTEEVEQSTSSPNHPSRHARWALAVPGALQQKWDPLIEAGGSIYAVDYLKLFNPGAGDGVLQDQAFAMFLGEDATNTPEVGLFDTWMKKTHPGFPLDLFAMFGWAEARLFVDALKTTGSNPTQPGLIAALKNIHHFNSNGLISPADHAGKVPPECWLIVTVKNGAYERVTPDKGFTCQPGGYFRYTGT